MKNIWIQLRLLLAEKLLGMAMEIAPAGTTEKQDIALLVTEYCEKHTGKK